MWENIAPIISAATETDGGIWALIIIALALIAYGFFRRDSQKAKLVIFGVLFVAFTLFGLVSMNFGSIWIESISNQNQSKPATKVSLLLNRANQYIRHGENLEAHKTYEEAKVFNEQIGDVRGQAMVWLHIGNFEQLRDRNSQAIQAFTEAMHLYDSIGDFYGADDALLRIEFLEATLGAEHKDFISPLPNYAEKSTEDFDYLTRDLLVQNLAASANLSLPQAKGAVDNVFDQISSTLASGRDVRLVEFGTFSVAYRQATRGRNPRTGEEIDIPASSQPKFKAGKGLKDVVNQQGNPRGKETP